MFPVANPVKKGTPLKERKVERTKKLDKWARARKNAKSNVGEYTT